MKTVSTVVAATAKVPDLDILGVPQNRQNMRPSSTVWPTRFNPESRDVWDKMFKDTEVAAVLRSLEAPDAWNTAVAEYLTRCRKEGRDPFVSLSGTANERIRGILSRQRISVGRVIDALHLLPQFKLSNVRRVINRQNKGFTLITSCDMSPKVSGAYQDYVSLVVALCNNRGKFHKVGDRVLRRDIDAGTFIEIQCGPGVWKFRYSVSAHEHPELEITNRAPTRDQYERYVINELWLPAVREFKFVTNSNKRSLV
jgi:hypothetical protein